MAEELRLNHFVGQLKTTNEVTFRAFSPNLTPPPIFVTLCRWKRTLSASDSGPMPLRTKTNFLSVRRRGREDFA